MSYYKQPVTLVVDAGATTGSAPVTAVFEVASDETFGSLVATKSVSVAAHAASASVTLDPLPAARDFFWRVRTAQENAASLVSATFKFAISPEVRIEPPQPLQPVQDAFEHRRPRFVVANATHTGPTSSLSYRFEIADDPASGAFVSMGDVIEGSAQTSFSPATTLAAGQTYAWRARVTDTGTGAASAYSPVRTFTTRNPDDGTYPYTFRIQLPPTEDCEYVTDAVTIRYHHPLEFPVSLVALDDTLSVDEGLTVRANRTRQIVSGTLIGRLQLQADITGGRLSLGAGPLLNFAMPTTPAQFSGSIDRLGNVAGSFSGSAMASDCCYWWSCAAPAITWTLTPR